MGSYQPRFAFFKVYVGFGQLGISGSQAFHLPPFESEARFESVLDEIVMACPPINGDHVARWFFWFLFAHWIQEGAIDLRADYTGKALSGTRIYIRIAATLRI